MESTIRELNRRIVRRLIFSIRDGKVGILDKKEKVYVDGIRDYFDGFLLNSIGWQDFTFKWDVHPEDPSRIISYFEWKDWEKEWSEENPNAVPPPCFTRQGQLGE